MARSWQTVLVSVVAHVVAVFLLVVVPLLAFDGLPSLKSTIRFVAVDMKAPKLPEVVAAAEPAPANTPPVGPPTQAPDAIRPEIVRPPALAVDVAAVNVAAVNGTNGLLANTMAAIQTDVVPAPRRVPDEPVRPGGNVKPPQRVSYVRPEYPPVALAARVTGSVFIEAIIGTDGLVRDARVIRSVPLLNEAALRAVRQWRYSPTLLNGIPVEVIMTVTVTFSMDRLRF